MTALPLDSRQTRIARLLLDDRAAGSVEQLAAHLQLSQRVVRYNLPAVEAYLARYGLQVVKRRGVGVWLEGDAPARAAVRAALDTAQGPAVLDTADRQSRVLLTLLEAAPVPVRSEILESRLEVSRPTVRRHVRAGERWLEQHRLHLRRLPGVGLAVGGSEVDVRAGLTSLVLEHLPANVLAALAGSSRTAMPDAGTLVSLGPAGLVDYVGELDLPTFRAILAAELREFDDRDPANITAILGLAVQASRVRAGRLVRLVRGRLRSLLDHPVSDAGRRIAAAIRDQLALTLPPPEIAALTETLLGSVELTSPRGAPDAQLARCIDRLIAVAATRLHPSLAEDDLLRTNLTEHLRRLQVRLRYGLPVSNPLQHEVRRRYQDVYDVAADIVAELGPLGGGTIPVEEVGFLTMYLAGSLERLRLRPKARVTVVCPAGMATAWILVSRLLAEFPQLEVAQVVSKIAFEHEESAVPSDLVISTVPLRGSSGSVPVLIVSPLLEQRDVRRLARLLELPAER
jgi:mannitol operon transcriptional antiterminator